MFAWDLNWLDLVKVILINIVLSGDNSVVIALACRRLPVDLQRQAYMWGSCGAVVMKIALTFVAAALLEIPFLQMVGGLLLVVIAMKLLKGEDEEASVQQKEGLLGAIRTIIAADVVMSLDNTVAVVAAADGNRMLIVIGLVVCAPVIIWGADLMTKLMNRYAFLVYGAAALLGLTAGEMILEDSVAGAYLKALLPIGHDLIPWLFVAFLLVYGRIQARRVVAVPLRHWKKD